MVSLSLHIKNTFPINHHLFLFTTKCLNVLLLSDRRYKQICHKIFIMTHKVVLTSLSIEIRKYECTAYSVSNCIMYLIKKSDILEIGVIKCTHIFRSSSIDKVIKEACPGFVSAL